MDITNREETNPIQSIALSSNNTSEKVKDAIIEMNIMRGQKVSRDELINLIENY
ncbi:hypothetical protein [Clostridium cylindrosporum]|uniref:Uncharacterized protein n=1 Tax=Clostridium cylindrosporum DSM 605 TaxID=1121307 RepID=A0A0J8DFD0_CLOCY|nr:hypothetical protein [Clostridium cylindrosporum]KMT22959.1 hypothetical protein CLCY_7c00060 [Clostridium cylindrosporum DSM 605]